MFNKKGQIGETMTWLIATVIIILIIIMFLFSSSILSKAKNIKITFNNLEISSDVLLVKSTFTYFLLGKEISLRNYLIEKTDIQKMEEIWDA